MKSVFVVLAALAASVVAQLDVPSCAEPCIQPMLTTKVGSCEAADVKCICSDQATIVKIGQCLTEQKCSDADIQKTIGKAYALCKAAGVNIPTTIPVAATTTPPATGTETGTSTYPTTTHHSGNNTNTNSTATVTTQTPSSTGAAATGYVANGLGVAGAAVAAFLFL